MRIQHLQNENIDKDRWDQCIRNAENGLVYAFSNYLDLMSPGWNGLILNDYEAVMPLPTRAKFGVKYIYQPAFCAQLGLFGNNLTPRLFDKFLEAIPKRYRYWDMNLNYGNVFESHYPLYIRKNYVLDLNHPYDEIAKNYRENTRRNIKKASDSGCFFITDISVTEIISLAIKYTPGIDTIDLNRFEQLFDFFYKTNQALTYGVYTHSKELVSSSVFFFSHTRAYYILVGNHPNGKMLGASHMLIDGFIRDHSNTAMKLDFEGSDLSNLAFFYSSFGAKEENYTAIHLNLLPWYLKILKS